MSEIEGYPLQWPVGFPRTHDRKHERGKFDTSLAAARDGIVSELRKMGARDIVISSNIPLRKDGLPYATYRTPDDTGVAVYWTIKGEQKCMPCDRYFSVESNMQAINKTLGAIRGIERWSTGAIIDAMFQGFTALPAQASAGWWVVLGLPRDASRAEVGARSRALAKRFHPDMPEGDVDMFLKIQAAYDDFERERGGCMTPHWATCPDAERFRK